jgi:hypothetical protein
MTSKPSLEMYISEVPLRERFHGSGTWMNEV